MKLSNIQGGGGQQYQLEQRVPEAPAAASNPTTDLLMKMGNSFLEKSLQAKKAEMFTKGMQRVAAGEAYKDIRQESNGFADALFGKSATMQGAAAMAKVSGVENFTTKALNEMQGNAQMSPEQFRKHLIGNMQENLTGDPDVDNVVQAKMVENMAPLMKAQTKANYEFVQQESARNYTNMMSSAGDTFFATAGQAANGTLSQKDLHMAAGRLLLASQPPAGMNPETYRKTLLNTSILQMSKGNLWVDKVYQQSGMYDMLNADDQIKLETARKTYSDKVAQEFGSLNFGTEIAQIEGGAAGRSPAENAKLWTDLNQRWKTATGSDYDILGMKDLVGMQKSSYSRMFAMQDKMSELRAKAALDDRANNELVSTIARGVDTGAGGFLVGLGAKKKDVDLSFDAQFQMKAQANPDAAVDQVISNYNHGMAYVNPQLQSRLLEPLRQLQGGGVPGVELDNAIQMIDAMQAKPDSQGTIDGYLGAENAVRIQRYRSALQAFEGDKVKAAQLAFSEPVLTAPKVTSTELKPQMVKVIEDTQEGKGVLNWLDRKFRGVPNMSDASKDLVLQSVAPDAQVYMNAGLDPQTAIQRALKGSGVQKVDVIGRYAYSKRPDQQPLAALVGTDDSTMALTFPKFLQSKARQSGVFANVPGGGSSVTSKKGEANYWTSVTDLGGFWGGKESDVSLMRAPDSVDSQGNPLAVFSGLLYNGSNSARVDFTSQELKEFYEQNIKNRNDITETLRKAGL